MCCIVITEGWLSGESGSDGATATIDSGAFMTAWWLILLIPIAFGGVLWWRRRIDRSHNAFQTKMDLAGDEDYARQQLQRYYNKRSGVSAQPDDGEVLQDDKLG